MWIFRLAQCNKNGTCVCHCANCSSGCQSCSTGWSGSTENFCQKGTDQLQLMRKTLFETNIKFSKSPVYRKKIYHQMYNKHFHEPHHSQKALWNRWKFIFQPTPCISFIPWTVNIQMFWMVIQIHTRKVNILHRIYVYTLKNQRL